MRAASVNQNEAAKQVVPNTVLGGMRHTAPILNGSQLPQASISFHVLPGRGSEKAFNECLGVSNILRSVA